jgi:ParB-like chromosome segregation protein Spo0J
MSESEIEIETNAVSVEALDPSEDKYQVMPDLESEEYEALRSDIQENGVRDRITVAKEDGESILIDGFHRVEIAQELEIEDLDCELVFNASEDELFRIAYERNTHRRNLDEGQKKQLAKDRIQYLDSEGRHEAIESIANMVAVSTGTVTNARNELLDSDSIVNTEDWATQDQKKEIATEYIRENPDESNSSIASEVPVSATTVGRIKNEIEEQEDDTDDSPENESREEGRKDDEPPLQSTDGDPSSDESDETSPEEENNTNETDGFENPYKVAEDGTVELGEDFAGAQVRVERVEDD